MLEIHASSRSTYVVLKSAKYKLYELVVCIEMYLYSWDIGVISIGVCVAVSLRQ